MKRSRLNGVVFACLLMFGIDAGFEVFLLSDSNFDYFASITESSWHLHAAGNIDFPATTTAGVTGTVILIPASVWLFGSGLLGLIGISRRRK